MSEITAEEVEERVNKGLVNKWYPVHASWAVTERPIGITRLSENIVLWRASNGEVHALEDRCPHRGARLSLGWNLNDRIACWYHGIELDGEGVVQKVPAIDNCPLEKEKCLKAYPVKEHKGAIFLYFGDAANAKPCDLEFPEELVHEDYSSFLVSVKWECSYRYAIDNVMDPMHGAYLHAKSHSMADGDKQADFHAKKTPTGFIFEKREQAGVNFDWVEMGSSGTDWLRLAIPYGKDGGPGGDFSIVGFATPVDEKHCQVFFWRIRKVAGWQRGMWRMLYKNRLEKLHWDVLAQDELILSTMDDEARNHEWLYQHDMGLTRVRRQMQKEAKKQLMALGEYEQELQPA